MRFLRANTQEQLKDLVLQKKCIAFIGAGFSIPPSKAWQPLVKKIAQECGIPYDPDDIYHVIDACIELNERACNETLRHELPLYIPGTRNAIPELLNLQFKAILTTNFDPWIWREANRNGYPQFYVYPTLPGLREGMFYLHGQFNSESPNSSISKLVFGEKSFKEAYDNSLLTGLLMNLLVYERIAFISFNPLEEHFVKLIKKSNHIYKYLMNEKGQSAPGPRHFCLWPAPNRQYMTDEEIAENRIRLREIESLEIAPVIYPMEGKDHRGLERLLHNWREQGDPDFRPPRLATGFEGDNRGR